ncbi:MAG: L-threonylcarbamoyladenylate synthase [Opitutaceae bacterium]
MATIYKGSDSDLFFLSERLRAGELVAVPTETVYGLAANALDAGACRRIFEAKERPAHDPLIVHVANRQAAENIAVFNEAASLLAIRFWPGPLSLVLPKKPAIPDILTSGRPTVAVRVPAHPLMHALLERCRLPLAAPSANPFGYVSPTTVEHVQHGLGERIKYILDGGPCAVGVESTIVDARDADDPVILRPGGLAREAIEQALGRPVRVHAGSTQQSRASRAPEDPAGELAPGMLDRHYSPRTPVVLRKRPFTPEELENAPPGVARVCIQKPTTLAARSAGRLERIFWLSESGDIDEAARRLFALMRELDATGFARIEFEPAPSSALGLAINDRLRRAAAPAP